MAPRTSEHLFSTCQCATVFAHDMDCKQGEKASVSLDYWEIPVKTNLKPMTYNTSQLSKHELAFQCVKRILLCFKASKRNDEGNLPSFALFSPFPDSV